MCASDSSCSQTPRPTFLRPRRSRNTEVRVGCHALAKSLRLAVGSQQWRHVQATQSAPARPPCSIHPPPAKTGRKNTQTLTHATPIRLPPLQRQSKRRMQQRVVCVPLLIPHVLQTCRTPSSTLRTRLLSPPPPHSSLQQQSAQPSQRCFRTLLSFPQPILSSVLLSSLPVRSLHSRKQRPMRSEVSKRIKENMHQHLPMLRLQRVQGRLSSAHPAPSSWHNSNSIRQQQRMQQLHTHLMPHLPSTRLQLRRLHSPCRLCFHRLHSFPLRLHPLFRPCLLLLHFPHAARRTHICHTHTHSHHLLHLHRPLRPTRLLPLLHPSRLLSAGSTHASTSSRQHAHHHPLLHLPHLHSLPILLPSLTTSTATVLLDGRRCTTVTLFDAALSPSTHASLLDCLCSMLTAGS